MDENIQQGNYDRKITDNEFSKTDLQVNDRKGPGLGSWVLFFVLLGSTLFTTYLAGGKLYALSLFLILGAHEFGHYFASFPNTSFT